MFIYFLQYILALSLVMIVLPRIMFAKTNEGATYAFFAGFSRMLLAVIVIGYLLVITKLFEFITILFLFLLLAFRKYYLSKSHPLRKRTMKDIRSWITDYIEGIVDLPRVLTKKIRKTFSSKKSGYGSSMAKIFFAVVTVFTVLYSLYIRLYDAFTNAAPAMSDAYVTLAWSKYITNRILFHDGIYPQGFYIYQAIIQKFSGLDMLYVLKFTGPIGSFLISYGIYFAVSRFSKCKYAGFLAGGAYGLFGMLFTGSLERQAASNSQEFAFILIMPAIYFFYKYAQSKEKKDLIIAGSALAAIGLTHSLAFIYAAMGIFILGISILIVDFSSFKKISIKVLISGIAAGVLSVIPVGLGLALGKGFHQASADFVLASGYNATLPVLLISDYVAIAGMAVCFIYAILNFRKENAGAFLFLSLFGVFSFLLYYFGGIATGSLVIEARARELFSIASPVVIGSGFAAIFNMLKRLDKKEILRPALSSGIVVAFIAVFMPAPITPYKMEFNSSVEQYLRISSEYTPTQWLIVSQEEGYAMAYGKGWHLMVGDFLDRYNEDDAGLISAEGAIDVPHVFVFHEKRIYRTYTEMVELEEAHERRLKESEELGVWIEEQIQREEDMILFYEDENLAVYHIYQPEAFDEINEKVKGPEA